MFKMLDSVFTGAINDMKSIHSAKRVSIDCYTQPIASHPAESRKAEAVGGTYLQPLLVC